MANNVTQFKTSSSSIPAPRFASRVEEENILRGEIRGERPLIAIQQTIQWLMLGHIPNWASPRGLPSDPQATLLGWQPLQNQDIPRLKVALDANLKLLNKILPDLRSLDFNDQTPQPQLSDLELAARVASIVGGRVASLPHSPGNLLKPPIDLVPIIHTARRDNTPLGHVEPSELVEQPSPEACEWM